MFPSASDLVDFHVTRVSEMFPEADVIQVGRESIRGCSPDWTIRIRVIRRNKSFKAMKGKYEYIESRGETPDKAIERLKVVFHFHSNGTLPTEAEV